MREGGERRTNTNKQTNQINKKNKIKCKQMKKIQTNANICKQTNGGARQQYVTEERTRGKKWQPTRIDTACTVHEEKGEGGMV